MKLLKSIFLLINLSIINVFYLSAQKEPVKIKRITEAVKFDGIPDEGLWKELNSFKLTMWRPNFGAETSETSEVRIGYDDKYLWVGASLYMKDPSRIFVAAKKRDEMLWDYDAFGIILDTYNDNENGLAFFTNPTGLRTDFTISNDGSSAGGSSIPWNTSWDTFWDVKTFRDEKGWYLEMRIPFSSLKIKTENGIATMGMILQRSISSNNETDLYPAIDRKYGYSAFTKPSQAAKINIEGAQPTKPIYIAPYLLSGFSRENVQNNTETQYNKMDKPEFNGGLDIKYNINSNLTIDLTANTDFAQVEADDQQVNLTQYSLFFPEKRKFFQERSSLFDFNLGGIYDNLFYSRNIGLINGNTVHIYGGTRLTGRIGKWDIGFLDMQTAGYDTIPGENFGVLRMRRQVINQNSYIGGMFTSRFGMNGNQNLAYGVDGIFRLFGDDYLSVKWSQTYDNKLEEKVSFPKSSFALFNWERRSENRLGYNFSYIYSGSEFNPGIGFIMRHAIHGVSGSILYGWVPAEKSKLLNYSINLTGNFYQRLSDCGIESINVYPYFAFGTKKGVYGQIGVQYQREGVLNDFNLSDKVRVLTGDYSFLNTLFSVSTTSTKKLSYSATANIGGFYNGNRKGFSIGPNLSASPSLNFSVMYSFDVIRFPDRMTNNSLDIHSVNLKVLYMYSTKLSASMSVQYMNTQDDLITNFRLRYNPREGNDFYLVYNDSRGITGLSTGPQLPRFFNKTIIAKFVHTFTLR